MVRRIHSLKLLLVARAWSVLLLAWLALPDGGFAQVVDEEQSEAVRLSASLAQQAKKPDLAQVAELIIQQTNQFRQAEGLAKVDDNPKLMATTRYFADFMAKKNQYGHTADGKRPADRAKQHGYDYCLIAENIAYEFSSEGFATSELAEKLVEGWKRSPEHRKNMLDSAVTETGVAVSQSPDTGYFYAVQMFGRPKSQAIEFQVENQSAIAIEYQIAGRTFSLPPSYTRTHQQCRPTELTFQWPDGPQLKLETVQATSGARLIVIQEGGKLKLDKK